MSRGDGPLIGRCERSHEVATARENQILRDAQNDGARTARVLVGTVALPCGSPPGGDRRAWDVRLEWHRWRAEPAIGEWIPAFAGMTTLLDSRPALAYAGTTFLRGG